MTTNLTQDCPRYLVLTRCMGKPVWIERDDADCDARTTTDDLYNGQIEHPVQVVLINVGRGLCIDVSAEFAEDIAARAVKECTKLRDDLADFVEHVLGVQAAHGLREAA